jgi:protein-S-isoprenylcysteine O-methyltransferase Ste14
MVEGTPPADPGARVFLPPPLLYAAAMGFGWWLQRKFPRPIAGLRFEAAAGVVGWAIVFAGVGLALWAAATFRRAGTSPVPFRPVHAFVLTGPYRFMRNPMYTGLSVVTAGVSLTTNTWWIAAFLIPVVLVIRFYVIAKEERYLEGKFGDSYRAYVARVRRWL